MHFFNLLAAFSLSHFNGTEETLMVSLHNAGREKKVAAELNYLFQDVIG